MKYLFMLLSVAFLLGACSKENEKIITKVEKQKETIFSQVTIPISGMRSNACVVYTEKKLKTISGAIDIKVSLSNNEAQITYEKNKTSTQEFSDAIDKIGFKAGAPIVSK